MRFKSLTVTIKMEKAIEAFSQLAQSRAAWKCTMSYGLFWMALMLFRTALDLIMKKATDATEEMIIKKSTMFQTDLKNRRRCR